MLNHEENSDDSTRYPEALKWLLMKFVCSPQKKYNQPHQFQTSGQRHAIQHTE